METTGFYSLIIQGGSFALLAYLIVFEWPKAVQRMVDSYDKAVASFEATNQRLTDRAEDRHQRLVSAFAEQQKYERDQCERHHAELLTVGDRNHESETRDISITRHEMRNHFQIVLNHLTAGRVQLPPFDPPPDGGGREP